MFEIYTLALSTFYKLCKDVKVISINARNYVRSICFGGALLPALFLEKEIFFGKIMIF